MRWSALMRVRNGLQEVLRIVGTRQHRTQKSPGKERRDVLALSERGCLPQELPGGRIFGIGLEAFHNRRFPEMPPDVSHDPADGALVPEPQRKAAPHWATVRARKTGRPARRRHPVCARPAQPPGWSAGSSQRSRRFPPSRSTSICGSRSPASSDSARVSRSAQKTTVVSPMRTRWRLPLRSSQLSAVV